MKVLLSNSVLLIFNSDWTRTYIITCGTVLLYVSPESYAGGVLELVENGDIMEVDVKTGDSI